MRMINSVTNIFSSKKNRSKAYFIIVLLSTIVFFFGYNFNDPHGYFDVGRYYEMVDELFPASTPIGYIIAYEFAIGWDFIYYVVLFVFNQTSLGMPFVTGCVCFLYYYFSLKVFANNINKLTSQSTILLLGLFSLPNVIRVIENSRTSMAVLFLFIGILFHFKKKHFLFIFFFICAALTHIGSLMFSGLYFLVIVLYFLWLNKKQKLVKILCLLLPPLLIISITFLMNTVLTSDVMDNLFADGNYTKYLSTQEGESKDNMSWVFKLQFWGTALTSYVLMNLDDKNSFLKVLFLFYGSITISMWSVTQNFLYRWMIVLPLIFSLYFTEVYVNTKNRESKTKNKSLLSTLQLISCINIIIYLLMLIGNRDALFAF